jgi:GNAT superfamily N-acetyltransferase
LWIRPFASGARLHRVALSRRDGMSATIRRIKVNEVETVTRLWDAMCREVVNGGPLSERGWHNIARMLGAAADHADLFCLVAALDREVVGFVTGCLTRDPLGSGVTGELEELYVTPRERRTGLRTRLAEDAITWLDAAGARPICTHVCADNRDARGFWSALGFEDDVVRLTRY